MMMEVAGQDIPPSMNEFRADPTAEPREFLSAEQHQCPCGKPMVPSLVTPFEGLFAMPDSRRNILTESQPTHFKGGGRATLTRSSRGQSNCQECIQRADFERGKYRMTDMLVSQLASRAQCDSGTLAIPIGVVEYYQFREMQFDEANKRGRSDFFAKLKLNMTPSLSSTRPPTQKRTSINLNAATCQTEVTNVAHTRSYSDGAIVTYLAPIIPKSILKHSSYASSSIDSKLSHCSSDKSTTTKDSNATLVIQNMIEFLPPTPEGDYDEIQGLSDGLLEAISKDSLIEMTLLNIVSVPTDGTDEQVKEILEQVVRQSEVLSTEPPESGSTVDSSDTLLVVPPVDVEAWLQNQQGVLSSTCTQFSSSHRNAQQHARNTSILDCDEALETVTSDEAEAQAAGVAYSGCPQHGPECDRTSPTPILSFEYAESLFGDTKPKDEKRDDGDSSAACSLVDMEGTKSDKKFIERTRNEEMMDCLMDCRLSNLVSTFCSGTMK